MQGDLRTSMDDDGRNAVTWGVFPGQEIVQTTIIERESFLAWKVCCAKLPIRRNKSLHALPGCGILTLGGLGFSLSASIAGARITRRVFERRGGWSVSSTTIISTPTRFGTFCPI
jgi:hypothetical protein